METEDIKKIKAEIAEKIDDLGRSVNEIGVEERDFEYGKISGLIETYLLISKAQKGEL